MSIAEEELHADLPAALRRLLDTPPLTEKKLLELSVTWPGFPDREATHQGGSVTNPQELPYSFDGLHHTQLAIPPGAEGRIRAFYADILGMTELEKPPVLAARGGCWFGSGALELHFGVEKDFAPARKGHPGILVADLDALAKRLTDAGVDVDWDDNFPGHRRFYAFDPVGNRLEFLEPEAGQT